MSLSLNPQSAKKLSKIQKQVVDKHFIFLSVQKFRSYYDPMGKKTVSVFSKTYVREASHEKELTQVAKKISVVNPHFSAEN